MHLISFKSTVLFKRGIWLSAAALIVFVAAPPLLDGSLRQDPMPGAFAICVLSACLIYFFWKTQVHRLADQVLDGEEHLTVRRGPTEVVIPWSKVVSVDVAIFSGIPRITIRLRDPGRFGDRIEFLPQASLWSNPGAIKSLVSALSSRAKSSDY
jgi:hypothetical protein